MVGMLSMHGVPKPTKNRGIFQHIMENSQDMANTHFKMMLPQEAKNGPF